MPSDSYLTPFRRDVLHAVVALALLSAPLWVPATNVGESAHTYERAQVVVGDEDGIAYANDTKVPFGTPISDNIVCSDSWEVRPCAFEQYLASNNTVPTEIHTTNPDAPHGVPIERYGYALVDGTVYETGYVANRSVQNENDMYRLDLALEPISADDALRAVSVDASSEYADVPPVVIEAGRTGEATSYREVDVPKTPLRLDDGTYYRVYHVRTTDPTPLEGFLRTILPVLGPLIGFVSLYRLSRRIEVTHVDTES